LSTLLAPSPELQLRERPHAGFEDLARSFIAAAKAPSTLRAYRSDWNQFAAWCAGQALAFLPAEPDTVALYLAASAGACRPGTLTRRLTAISKAHQAAGLSSPATLDQAVVSETLKGIRRTFGTAQTGKRPLLTKDIRKMIRGLPEGLAGTRDRALLLLGFAGGFRRSELAALDIADIAFTDDGLVLTLRRSKTDPEGQGRKVALPSGSHPETCPVRALRRWLEESGLSAGALFRAINRHHQLRPARLHQDSIGLIVKRAAEGAGLDPAAYAGHSLRAGLVTQAYLNGATELAIMKQTGHKSVRILRQYIREGSLFRDNAAAKLDL
jgi:integrase